jgi:hypothetical protein
MKLLEGTLCWRGLVGGKYCEFIGVVARRGWWFTLLALYIQVRFREIFTF